MAALTAVLAVLTLIAGLTLAALTHAFKQDERDHRSPERPEADR